MQSRPRICQNINYLNIYKQCILVVLSLTDIICSYLYSKRSIALIIRTYFNHNKAYENGRSE